MTEVDRLKAELAEALRVLNRRTGMQWGPTIYSRVMSGMRSDRCDECAGDGLVHRTGPISGDWTERCETCAGSGEILVPNGDAG